MRLPAVLLIALALIAVPAAAAAARPHHSRHAASARTPVVVELYTAQGCADCPGADNLLVKLAERPDVIALTFPVDYWDYLGWHDTFAKAEFADRQHAYMKAMKLRDVYTPQVVVDGKAQVAGTKTEEVEAAVKAAERDPAARPDISAVGRSKVEVGSGRAPNGGATVWLVRYRPGTEEVRVNKGENKGRTIRQGHVVRELVKLGPWRGSAHTFRLPKAGEKDLKSVILVQSTRTGRILAARRL
jgi:hypothetical protein